MCKVDPNVLTHATCFDPSPNPLNCPFFLTLINIWDQNRNWQTYLIAPRAPPAIPSMLFPSMRIYTREPTNPAPKLNTYDNQTLFLFIEKNLLVFFFCKQGLKIKNHNFSRSSKQYIWVCNWKLIFILGIF